MVDKWELYNRGVEPNELVRRRQKRLLIKQWKKLGRFVVVVQLIHRMTEAHISYTTTAGLFFFPLLGNCTRNRFPFSQPCIRPPAPPCRKLTGYSDINIFQSCFVSSSSSTMEIIEVVQGRESGIPTAHVRASEDAVYSRLDATSNGRG